MEASASGTVVVASTRVHFGRLIRAWMAGSASAGKLELSVHDVVAQNPEEARGQILAISARHRVMLLVDPLEESWLDFAGRARASDERLGLVVLTLRAHYLWTRRWRQEVAGRKLADAIVTLDSSPADIWEALKRACGTPGTDTGFWPEGPLHPARFATTPEGRAAEEIRRSSRYETLLRFGVGATRDEVASALGVRPDTITDQMTELRRLLDARNDVELGRRATELGLFEDVPPDLG